MKEIKDKIVDIVNNEDEILLRSYFVLVRSGYKRDVRGDVLYKPYNNKLELQYKVDISDLKEGCSVIMSEKLIEKLDISKEKFFDTAYKNTVNMRPPKFESISDVIHLPFDDLPMYVLTNETQTFGAGAILYPNMKEKLQSIIGDFIVIPSSVHECIIFPSAVDIQAITNIIKEVNTTVVDEEEVLSDVPFRLTDLGELIEA